MAEENIDITTISRGGSINGAAGMNIGVANPGADKNFLHQKLKSLVKLD